MTANPRYELTILMPCLNEAETVATCVKKARGFLESRGINGEIVVADNGSTDGSQGLATAAGARVVPISSRGYGAALIGGIEASRGEYIIMADADDSYDFSNLDAFVAKLREGHDLVMGNRFLGGIADGAMPPLHRYLGNPVLTGIGRLFFRSPCGDFHCGLRGFRRDAIRTLNLTAPGMEFASEMVVKATLRQLRIAEVPTTLSPDGRSRPPHLRSWRDGWRHLKFLLQFSPTWLFFFPGCALFVFGLTGMAWILPGPVQIGATVLDVNTLVFCSAALICGLQSILLYFSAAVYSARMRLLPDHSWIQRLRTAFTIERGLIAGLLLVLSGVGLAAYAVGIWGTADFGDLDASDSLRIVIPSATLIVSGFQLAFFACLLSVLQLETRRPGARTRASDDGANAPRLALAPSDRSS
jgi:glycosyltransferase involved in cell wall biosynthesis